MSDAIMSDIASPATAQKTNRRARALFGGRQNGTARASPLRNRDGSPGRAEDQLAQNRVPIAKSARPARMAARTVDANMLSRPG
jgi:hypothetical protein